MWYSEVESWNFKNSPDSSQGWVVPQCSPARLRFSLALAWPTVPLVPWSKIKLRHMLFFFNGLSILPIPSRKRYLNFTLFKPNMLIHRIAPLILDYTEKVCQVYSFGDSNSSETYHQDLWSSLCHQSLRFPQDLWVCSRLELKKKMGLDQ